MYFYSRIFLYLEKLLENNFNGNKIEWALYALWNECLNEMRYTRTIYYLFIISYYAVLSTNIYRKRGKYELKKIRK